MGSASTTGLQNEDRTIGITFACNRAATITDSLAVCYIHPASGKTDCLPSELGLVDVNDGVCVFTKSVPNEIHIEGATPFGKVALIMGKGPGSFVVNGSVCNGLVLDMGHPRIVGLYTADVNGAVHEFSPIPPWATLADSNFKL